MTLKDLSFRGTWVSAIIDEIIYKALSDTLKWCCPHHSAGFLIWNWKHHLQAHIFSAPSLLIILYFCQHLTYIPLFKKPVKYLIFPPLLPFLLDRFFLWYCMLGIIFSSKYLLDYGTYNYASGSRDIMRTKREDIFVFSFRG